MSEYVASLMDAVKAKDPAQPEFHQAVEEVAESCNPFMFYNCRIKSKSE